MWDILCLYFVHCQIIHYWLCHWLKKCKALLDDSLLIVLLIQKMFSEDLAINYFRRLCAMKESLWMWPICANQTDTGLANRPPFDWLVNQKDNSCWITFRWKPNEWLRRRSKSSEPRLFELEMVFSKNIVFRRSN